MSIPFLCIPLHMLYFLYLGTLTNRGLAVCFTFFGFPVRLITRQFRLKNTCHIIPQRSTFVLQIQVFNLGFSVVRQQLFLCPFDKMSGMKLLLQGCCNRAFFMIFSNMLYSILASITNSLGLSLPSQAIVWLHTSQNLLRNRQLNICFIALCRTDGTGVDLGIFVTSSTLEPKYV